MLVHVDASQASSAPACGCTPLPPCPTSNRTGRHAGLAWAGRRRSGRWHGPVSRPVWSLTRATV